MIRFGSSLEDSPRVLARSPFLTDLDDILCVILCFKHKVVSNWCDHLCAGGEDVQTQDKETLTEWVGFDKIVIFKMLHQQMLKLKFCDLRLDWVLYLFISLSESSLLLEPPSDSHSSQNNCPPVTKCLSLTDMMIEHLYNWMWQWWIFTVNLCH